MSIIIGDGGYWQFGRILSIQHTYVAEALFHFCRFLPIGFRAVCKVVVTMALTPSCRMVTLRIFTGFSTVFSAEIHYKTIHHQAGTYWSLSAAG